MSDPVDVYATCDLGPALAAIGEAGLSLSVYPAPTPPDRETILAGAAGARGLITTLRDPIDEALLEALSPTLEVVAQYAVGLDNVDVEAARRLGIKVVNTPDVLTKATAEFALFALGALARRLRASEALVRSGGWWGWHPSLPFLGREIAGMTVAVVGLGRIGRAFAARCAALDVELLLYSRTEDPAFTAGLQRQLDGLAEMGVQGPRRARFVSLDEALARADAVSLHVPLTPATRHLIDGAALAKMKPGALLVNTARGPVVDEAALAAALQSGHLGGAALDVFSTEPLPMSSPLLAPALEDKVRLFHHFGSGTEETRLSTDPDRGMAGRCVSGLLAALRSQGA